MAFDPQNTMSEETLTRAVWWVEHKLLIRRIATALLGAVALSFLGYGLYGFGDWMFGSGVRERQELAQLPVDLTNAAELRQSHAPEDLGIEDTAVLAAGAGKYDMAARVTNPNAHWWAEFDYRFGGDATAAARHGYLLPGDAKYMLTLGVKVGARPSSAGLAIENLVWHRADPHLTLPDYVTWSTARTTFAVSGITFTPSLQGDPLGISRATFTVKNETAFGYHAVGFTVALLSGGRLVGINYVTISDLRAGESRDVSASWFSELPSVSRVEVQPDVNIFDVRSYLAPGE